jgi:hypothetical protein
MEELMQNRTVLLFAAILFILVVFPAFYPVEDEAQSRDFATWRA